jgi:hypothetical protein
MARKSLSKKTRFEVFKRDGFRCQYCGATPPSVILHVDHIIPVAEGGQNDEGNLITSCDACNLGKGARSLGAVPKSIADRSLDMREREDQILGYEELLREIRRNQEARIDDVQGAFQDVYPDRGFTPQFRRSVSQFLEKLPKDKVMSAMDKATSKCSGPDEAIKYFCGICWTIIRESNDA